jgi:hypothetical protein
MFYIERPWPLPYPRPEGNVRHPPQDKKTHVFERMACFLLTLLWQRTYMHSVLRAKKRKGGCAPPVMPRTKQRRDRARLF